MLHLSKYLIKIPLRREKFLLVINGLTGSVDIFFGKVKSFVENNPPGENCISYHLSKNITAQLKARKYLLTARQERLLYQDLVRKLEKKDRETKHLFVCINPTEQCNLACAYCINASNRSKVVSAPMSLSQVHQIFSILDSLKKQKRIIIAGNKIKMLGGEPLLPATRPALTQIAKECRKRRLKLDITTNGTYIINYFDLIRKFPKVFDHFQITVDGPREIHNKRRKTKTGTGYFDQIIKGIDILLKMGKFVELRSNLDDANINFLPDTGKLIKKHRWQKRAKFFYNPHPVDENYSEKPESCLPPFTRPQFLEKISKIIAKNPKSLSFILPGSYMAEPEELLLKAAFPKLKYRRFFPAIAGCATSGAHSFTFASDNKIYACNCAVGIKDFCLGEYYPKFKLYPESIKNWQKRFTHEIKECKDCRFQFLCGSSCVLSAYYARGRINGVEKQFCDQFQKELETAAEILKYPIKKVISKRLKRNKTAF